MLQYEQIATAQRGMDREQLAAEAQRLAVPAPTVNIPTTKDLRVLPKPVLPEKTAPAIMENYVGSVSQDMQTQRKALEDTYKRNLEDTKKQQEAAQAKIKQFTDKQENIIEGGVRDNTRPFMEDLEAGERQRLFVEKNFKDNQKLVDELDTLLTQSNQMMNQLRASKIPGLAGISQSPRAIQAMQDVSARVGVIQAVMDARNDQISKAYTMIDRSAEAINADRRDQLAYYNTLNDFYENQKDSEGSKLFQLNQDQKSWINKQVTLLEADLERSQATADYIKELMISPESAKFMAEAGVTLNDSVETIKSKMAKQAKVQERVVKAEANKQEAFQAGVKEMFYVKNGAYIRSSDGWEFESEEEFEKMTGMTIKEAEAKGMVGQLSADSILRREQVVSLMNEYWDAGIQPSDTLEDAVAKAQRSRSYLMSMSRSRGGSGGGSGGGGASGDIDSLASALANGDITITNVPSKLRAAVLQRVQEMASNRYADEQTARYDYNYDIDTLKNAVASGQAAGSPMDQVDFLYQQYGSKISREEIQGAVLDAYGVQPAGIEEADMPGYYDFNQYLNPNPSTRIMKPSKTPPVTI